jgi:hypothetical protein
VLAGTPVPVEVAPVIGSNSKRRCLCLPGPVLGYVHRDGSYPNARNTSRIKRHPLHVRHRPASKDSGPGTASPGRAVFANSLVIHQVRRSRDLRIRHPRPSGTNGDALEALKTQLSSRPVRDFRLQLLASETDPGTKPPACTSKDSVICV